MLMDIGKVENMIGIYLRDKIVAACLPSGIWVCSTCRKECKTEQGVIRHLKAKMHLNGV